MAARGGGQSVPFDLAGQPLVMHRRWAELLWTDWHPFTPAHIAAEAPSEPGLYPIPAVGHDLLV